MQRRTKNSIKTRRHLRDLTADSLCDPFLSFLHPRPLSWASAKILLEQIPQFLAKARRWSVQYDEYGSISIYEETHLLEQPPDKGSDQGNAQGMIDNSPFVSTFVPLHDVKLELPEPVHLSPMIVTHHALGPSMSANPSGTSPTVSRVALSPSAVPVTFGTFGTFGNVDTTAPVAKGAFATASSPAESIYNLWPVCTFCCRQDGTVRSHSDQVPIMLCASCSQIVRACQGVPAVDLAPSLSICGNCSREDSTVVIRNLGTENMMLCQTCSNVAERCRQPQRPRPVGSSSSSSGGSVETRPSCQEMPVAADLLQSFQGIPAAASQRPMHVADLGGSGTSLSGSRGDTSRLVSSLLQRMPKLPVKHGQVDTTGSEFPHYMATII